MKKSILFNKTQSCIKELETKLKAPVLVYWGTGCNGDVRMTDVIKLQKILENFEKTEKLYLVIRSTGGDPVTAYRLISLIRQYADQVNILVPNFCASAATLMALGGDKIYLSNVGHLGPIDVSVSHPLAPKGDRVGQPNIHIEEVDRLTQLMKEEDEIRSMGLKVEMMKPDIEEILYRLNNLYRRIAKTRKSETFKRKRKTENICKILEISGQRVIGYRRIEYKYEEEKGFVQSGMINEQYVVKNKDSVIKVKPFV